MTTPVKSAFSRVFITDGGNRPDHAPVYHYQLAPGASAQAQGDVTTIKEPSSDQYGEFKVIDETRSAEGRATLPIRGHYRMNERSELHRMSKAHCSVDVQVHFGVCQDPSDFNTFEKALVFDYGFFTNWATDDLGALNEGDNKEVNETADLSSRDFYEVLPVSASLKSGSIVTNEVLAVANCDAPSCGNCGSQSDGAKKVIAVTKAAGGSPSTNADCLYTLDGGATWYAHDIEAFSVAQDVNGVACNGQYAVVVSNAGAGLGWALKSELDGVTDPTWTKVATGFNIVDGKPNVIKSYGNLFVIGGDSGFIYTTTDPTAGVTAVESGTVINSKYIALDILSEDAWLLGGGANVVYTLDGGITFVKTATNPVGALSTVNAVLMLTESVWLVGCSTGNLYYTTNYGATWTAITFSGSGAGSVTALAKSTKSILWMAHQTAGTKGKLYRSFNGGKSWKAIPEKTGTFPACDKLNGIAVSSQNPNWYVSVGLADDASDGVLVVGASA